MANQPKHPCQINKKKIETEKLEKHPYYVNTASLRFSLKDTLKEFSKLNWRKEQKRGANTTIDKIKS